MTLSVQFFGAAQMVTGSKHLITTSKGKKILLDCGLFQGQGQDSAELNKMWGFEPASVDYLILSHAHIDHTGLVPKLVKDGFRGKIFSNDATRDLCEIMLADAAHIQLYDLRYVNKNRIKKGQPPVEPLFDIEDVEQALAMFTEVPMKKWFTIDDEVEVLLTDTAHILGSAAVNLRIKDGENIKTLTFSGDIGRPGDAILFGPSPFPQADYIICESTYGNRLHAPKEEVEENILKIVLETCVENRGKLIIPAFSIDRTQELVYALDRLEHFGKLPPIKVYVDSPLSTKATAVMNRHRDYFNKDILAYISRDGDPFNFKNLIYTGSVEASKAIDNSDDPCIIISSSGMAEAGRVKHHIKNNIQDPRCTVLLVGYATPDSLAGRLKNGYETVRIFGDEYPVKCNVRTMDNFSAHGDYKEMMEFLACQDTAKVKKLILVHGDYEVQQEFALKLTEMGFMDIDIPEMGQEIILD